MNAVDTLVPDVGMVRACAALSIPRSRVYRKQAPNRHLHSATATTAVAPRPAPPLALTSTERDALREVLYSERFADCAPRTIHATLLDEGVYLGSVRTMYRMLADAGHSHERRAQRRHPAYCKPELLATDPNQVWSWDITKLKGPAKWTCFHLYVILDIFSRYVVGWMLAHRESSDLASRLIRESLDKQGVSEDQLTLHSDRGPSMTSHNVAQLLATLGVTKSHSRPHVSNDNPFSESQFKTLKYRGDFPDRFASHEHGLSFCRGFFAWYNNEHYHSGIGLLTPATLHYGQARQVIESRAEVLQVAYAKYPERFVQGCPRPQSLPEAVWINPPTTASAEDKKGLPAAHCPQKPDASLTHP